MGKRLMHQRRGKGTSVFRARKRKLSSKYVSTNGETLNGEVMDLVKEGGSSTVLASILFENGFRETVVAAESIYIGQKIESGNSAAIRIGNTLPLSEIPDGCPMFNIEIRSGDGGKLARGSGMYSIVVTKEKNTVKVKLPSGSLKNIPLAARATIGCCAGGGRKEKPMVKAGAKFHAMKAKGRKYPRVRGVAMNAVSHPFGGEQHHAGKSKSTSRHAPPGRKVGAIASKRTGRRKK